VIHFKKNDPITDLINKSFLKLCGLNPSIENLEGLIKNNESNPLELSAIGFCYIRKSPSKARGYLSAYDGLHRLGFDGDSIAVLNSCIDNIGYHPLAVARLLNRRMAMRDYSGAFRLVAACPEETTKNLSENNSFVKAVIDLTKITKNSEAYDTLNLNIQEIDAHKIKIREKTARIQDFTVSASETYIKYVADEKFAAAEEFSWLAYNAGERSEEFFSAVCEPLVTELDISTRVMFFRIEASRYINRNPKLVAYGAKTFLYTGEVQSAYETISRALENSISSIELQHLYARSSVILGKVESILHLASSSSHANKLIYKHTLHRKLCQSILTGDLDEELHLRGLSRANGLQPQSPLSLIQNKTPIQTNSSPKVAICISGQLRGIEKSSKSIINDLANKVDSKIFIDTWKTQRSNFPTFTRVPRLIGQELFDLLPTELRMPDGFRKHLPATTKKLTNPITRDVTHEYVHEFFSSAHVRIEDEVAFETLVNRDAPRLTLRGNLNQAKMFYKIKKCQELVDIDVSNNETKYDVIIRTRPDLEITFPNIKEYVEMAHNNQNVVFVSYVTALGYGDQFAIGSKKAMDIYSSIWEKIWDSKCFKYSDTFDPLVSSFAGESLTANHLYFNGLNVRLIKPEKANFTTMLSINATNIEDELAADIEVCKIKNLLIPFQRKYLEMCKSKIAFT
jgi:hypothetical protein